MSLTSEAQEKLKKIIAEQLSVEEEDVVPEASFIEDLNADSLDLVELIMTLEEEFNIKISDEDAENIQDRSGLYRLPSRAPGLDSHTHSCTSLSEHPATSPRGST